VNFYSFYIALWAGDKVKGMKKTRGGTNGIGWNEGKKEVRRGEKVRGKRGGKGQGRSEGKGRREAAQVTTNCLVGAGRREGPQKYLSHDLDLSRSRDVIGHMTIRYPRRHFLLVVHKNRASISNHFRDYSSTKTGALMPGSH